VENITANARIPANQQYRFNISFILKLSFHAGLLYSPGANLILNTCAYCDSVCGAVMLRPAGDCAHFNDWPDKSEVAVHSMRMAEPLLDAVDPREQLVFG